MNSAVPLKGARTDVSASARRAVANCALADATSECALRAAKFNASSRSGLMNLRSNRSRPRFSSLSACSAAVSRGAQDRRRLVPGETGAFGIQHHQHLVGFDLLPRLHRPFDDAPGRFRRHDGLAEGGHNARRRCLVPKFGWPHGSNPHLHRRGWRVGGA